MTRRHLEVEVMRNKFYDEDPGGEVHCREVIRIALNWVLDPNLSDTDIMGYLLEPGYPAGGPGLAGRTCDR